MKIRKYNTLNKYMTREYILSFFVSFLFFFFIFFVNQILVLAQKILLKNVSVSDVLLLVILSIPQFLMYTMPFSSLASASMVIGNFASQNEILAMRSSGIHIFKIFRPIIIVSLFLSVTTLFIADKMIPYTASQYRVMYSRILQKLPSLELQSYSSTQFGKRVISNGKVDGNIVYDITIIDDADSSDSRVISASSAKIEVVDIDNFIYKIELFNPQILITDGDSQNSYSLSEASDMILYLNLSSNASGYTSITPSQMSISQLREAVNERKEEISELVYENQFSISELGERIGLLLKQAESGQQLEAFDFGVLESNANRIARLRETNFTSFYYQYYRSELIKKYALSFACTCLVFIAFPLSFLKIKYGRLTGFGISMLIACFYWFFLYYMHASVIQSSLNPVLFLWLPNITVFSIGAILILRMARK